MEALRSSLVDRELTPVLDLPWCRQCSYPSAGAKPQRWGGLTVASDRHSLRGHWQHATGNMVDEPLQSVNKLTSAAPEPKSCDAQAVIAHRRGWRLLEVKLDEQQQQQQRDY